MAFMRKKVTVGFGTVGLGRRREDGHRRTLRAGKLKGVSLGDRSDALSILRVRALAGLGGTTGRGARSSRLRPPRKAEGACFGLLAALAGILHLFLSRGRESDC